MADPGPDVIDFQGRQMYRLHVELLWAYPFDPNSPLMVLWAPPGGIGQANLPFMLKGEPGYSPTIQSVERTLLEYGNPTPDSYSMVELSPATADHGQIIKIVSVEHKGAPGSNGTSVLDPDAYGTKAAGRLLRLKADLSGFEYTPPTIVGTHWPATTPLAAPALTASNAAVALTSVTIAPNAYPFPTRVEVSGGTTVIGSGADVKVDLVARLNGTGGPVVGRCPGIGGVTDRLALIDGPDPGTDPADVTIAANAGCTVYLRSEGQGGTETYQTSSAATRMCVKVFRVG